MQVQEDGRERFLFSSYLFFSGFPHFSHGTEPFHPSRINHKHAVEGIAVCQDRDNPLFGWFGTFCAGWFKRGSLPFGSRAWALEVQDGKRIAIGACF